MRLLFLSDFDVRGGGYCSITAGLAEALSARGHEIIVLGIDYDGSEHPHGFTVLTSDPSIARQQCANIFQDWRPDAVAVIGDLSWQEKTVEVQRPEFVYAGVFAVEGAPMLTPSRWASAIKKMEIPYAISEFGRDTCHAAGLTNCRHMRIGLDPFWRPLETEEREEIRQNLGIADRFVIVTVADNQERKNLPCAIKAVALLREKGVNAYHILVTKPRPGWLGWDLWAEGAKHGLRRHMFVVDTSPRREKLREFYSIADAFLLTSKAEGLNLPALEAMACGTVPVVSRVGPLPALVKGRGLTIEPEYWYTDAFGNTERAFVSAEHAASQLHRLATNEKLRVKLARAGMKYARTLDWAETAAKFEEDILVKAKEKAEAATQAAPVANITNRPQLVLAATP